jgi:hypothetical protein
VMHRTVGRDAGVYIQFFKDTAQAHPVAQMTDVDSHRTVLVMHAHHVDTSRKTFVEHSGHGQQNPAGEILRRFHDGQI